MSTENVTAAENEIRSALELANDEEATSITHAMLANTLATLALVEQQRIANIIALSSELDPDAHRAVYVVSDERGGDKSLRPEIAKALGIA